jgi:transcriptional regulator with XRE-family HTH domain
MMEFGKTLRLAREAKGMTIEDVAEQTRIMSRTIENLEREIFTDIVAPIYGRGFVKLYCEAVGIDARPMIEEFMEIYNGNRESVIIERKVPAQTEPVVTEAPAEPPPVAPVTAAEPPPRPVTYGAENDLFTSGAFDSGIAAGEAPESVSTPERQLPGAEPSTRTHTAGATFSRYAAPIDDHVERPGFKLPSIPASVWRIAVLATLAVALLWALCAGVRALYRCTMPSEAEKSTPSPAPAMRQSGEAGVKPAPAAAPRTPVKIPPLYID